jgi:TPR repeat protein
MKGLSFLFLFWLRRILAVAIVGWGALAHAQDTASLERRAAAGNSDAQYRLGEDYINRGETGQALVWLRKAADSRHTAAEMALAQIYQEGKGVSPDEREAFKWYLKAADQGDDRAQTIIGIDYKFGESGTPKDIHVAARWFRMAAQKGNIEARTNLSELLSAGLIAEDEANWQVKPPVVHVEQSKSRPFTESDVKKGLRGGITTKHLISLVNRFGVDFTLTPNVREALGEEGADENLLYTISVSKR